MKTNKQIFYVLILVFLLIGVVSARSEVNPLGRSHSWWPETTTTPTQEEVKIVNETSEALRISNNALIEKMLEGGDTLIKTTSNISNQAQESKQSIENNLDLIMFFCLGLFFLILIIVIWRVRNE